MISRTTVRLLLIVSAFYSLYLFSPVLYLRFEIVNQIERLEEKSSQIKNIEIERNIRSFIQGLGQQIEIKKIEISRDSDKSKINLNYTQTVCFVGGWQKSCLLKIEHHLSS